MHPLYKDSLIVLPKAFTDLIVTNKYITENVNTERSNENNNREVKKNELDDRQSVGAFSNKPLHYIFHLSSSHILMADEILTVEISKNLVISLSLT